MSFSEKAIREREQYNEKSLKRSGFDRLLSHANTQLGKQVFHDSKKYMFHGDGGNALELGSHCWKDWIDRPGVNPTQLHCINISEAELESGAQLATRSSVKPVFHLMDAHSLQFPDDHFDLIFGAAILHHLDLDQAMAELNRVLKSDGMIIFAEPLDVNPVSKIIRKLTPKTRTADEQALRRKELNIISKYFDTSIITYQLFSVPLSCLSVFLFDRDNNPIMSIANFFDRSLQRIAPPLKWLYRYGLIIGRKLPLSAGTEYKNPSL
jgi:ubiquinone/menaquinone biosynthesis C-methylase UbiE